MIWDISLIYVTLLSISEKYVRKGRCVSRYGLSLFHSERTAYPDLFLCPDCQAQIFFKLLTFHKGKFLSDGVVRRHSQLLSALSYMHTIRQLKASSIFVFQSPVCWTSLMQVDSGGLNDKNWESRKIFNIIRKHFLVPAVLSYCSYFQCIHLACHSNFDIFNLSVSFD